MPTHHITDHWHFAIRLDLSVDSPRCCLKGKKIEISTFLYLTQLNRTNWTENNTLVFVSNMGAKQGMIARGFDELIAQRILNHTLCSHWRATVNRPGRSSKKSKEAVWWSTSVVKLAVTMKYVLVSAYALYELKTQWLVFPNCKRCSIPSAGRAVPPKKTSRRPIWKTRRSQVRMLCIKLFESFVLSPVSGSGRWSHTFFLSSMYWTRQ